MAEKKSIFKSPSVSHDDGMTDVVNARVEVLKVGGTLWVNVEGQCRVRAQKCEVVMDIDGATFNFDHREKV